MISNIKCRPVPSRITHLSENTFPARKLKAHGWYNKIVIPLSFDGPPSHSRRPSTFCPRKTLLMETECGVRGFISSHELKTQRWSYVIARHLLSVHRLLSSPSTYSNNSPLKRPGQLEPTIIFSLLGLGKRTFVQMVPVFRPSWLLCQYMI